jgi:long-chain fatty acid transport protein
LLLSPSLALASGYSVPNTNPRDLSMCASAVAAQRDSGAAFALPAALARLEGLSLSVGGGAVNFFTHWTDTGALAQPVSPPPSPGTADIASSFTGFPNVSVSWGGKLDFLGDRGFGAGLSVQPFGGTRVAWPGGWAGRYRILDVDRRVFSVIGSVALEVIPQIRVGGGLIYYYTTEKLNQNAYQEFVGATGTFTPGYPDAQAFVSLSGHAWSYDASVEVDPVKDIPLTIGVDYKHQGVQSLTGDVSQSGVSPVFQAPITGPTDPLAPAKVFFASTHATHQLTVPNTLNVGAAYRVAKPWLVTFTYTFDQWSVYGSDVITSNTGASIVVPRDYGNGQTFRAGVEWDALRELQLRAGVERDISGLKTDHYSPTLPDASSWAGSLGATYFFGGGLSVSAAVFYAHLDKVTSTNNGLESGVYPPVPPGTPVPTPDPNTTLRGSYEPWALIYSASVGWTPGARAK